MQVLLINNDQYTYLYIAFTISLSLSSSPSFRSKESSAEKMSVDFHARAMFHGACAANTMLTAAAPSVRSSELADKFTREVYLQS
jgi:hypothetical protein